MWQPRQWRQHVERAQGTPPPPLAWCTIAAHAAGTSGCSPAATAARMAQPRAGASDTCAGQVEGGRKRRFERRQRAP